MRALCNFELKMKNRSFCLLIVWALICLGSNLISAATIPAGTPLVVRSLDTITSVDVPGTKFRVEVISVGHGGTNLHGAKMTARVVTARRTYSSTQRLTVDLFEASIGGRSVPVKTTGAVQLDNTRFKTKSDVSVSRAGYSVPAGRVIQFRLAQPIQY